MLLIVGLLILVGAIVAVMRGIDVRLVLVLAALALGTVAGDPVAILRTFLATLAREQFVVPICCAMGFAQVLRTTGCDRHLVHLLVGPLRRVRWLLVPGAVVVGFLVNVPVISQTSTAVAIGSVLIPLLRAAQISPLTSGAALLLGASLGGELINPGAPELRTVSAALGVESTECVAHVLPLLMVQLTVATLVFWALSWRHEAAYRRQLIEQPAEAVAEDANESDMARVNPFKAAVTLLPLVLLFVTGPPLSWIEVPKSWLTSTSDQANYPSRLIGAAMLIGVAAATLTTPGQARHVAGAFFDGAGYAFTRIISLIVAAQCLGEGVRQVGFDQLLNREVLTSPQRLITTAVALPLGFALLSGSGMAATQSLFSMFVAASQALGIDPLHTGAVVSLGAAAGRTMSPVAAVTLMCASMTGNSPLQLAQRVVLPLLAGLCAVTACALFL
jgi:DcuC family C4-dicarboxylate transporter